MNNLKFWAYILVGEAATAVGNASIRVATWAANRARAILIKQVEGSTNGDR